MSSNCRISRRAVLAGTAGIATAGAFGTGRARAQAQRSMTLGIIGNTVEYHSVFIAQALGYFEAEGLRMDVVLTGGSANSAQMAAVNAVHVGSSSWLDGIRAIDRGAPLVVVANGLAKATTMMLGARGIRSVAELRGKRVIVGGAKDITMVWWEALARQNGLHGRNDVEVVFAGATPQRFAALAAGAVQAAAVATPLAFRGIGEGFVNLGVLGPLLPQVPYMTWHANKAWAEANQATLAAFLKANNRAIDFMYAPANRQRCGEILAQRSSVSLDDALKTHDLVVEIKGFEVKSAFTDEAVRGILQLLVDWGDVQRADGPLARYVDRKFLAAAG